MLQLKRKPKSPSQLDLRGGLTPLLQLERNLSFPLQLKKSPDSHFATPEETRVPRLNLRGGLT